MTLARFWSPKTPEVWSLLTEHSSSSLNLVLAVWLAAQTWRLHQSRVNGQLAYDPLFSAVTWETADLNWICFMLFGDLSFSSTVKNKQHISSNCLNQGDEHGDSKLHHWRQCNCHSNRPQLSDISRRGNRVGKTIFNTRQQSGAAGCLMVPGHACTILYNAFHHYSMRLSVWGPRAS